MSRKTEVVKQMENVARRIEAKERDLAFLEGTDVKHINSITLEYIDKSENRMLGRIVCPAPNIDGIKLAVELIMQTYREEINLTYEMLGRLAKEL